MTIADDADQVTDVVISLMQESVRMDQNYSIGFMIYKVAAALPLLSRPEISSPLWVTRAVTV